MRFGWLLEAGVLLVFASPILWALSAAAGLPPAITATFMWLTVALVVVVLASMTALPFLTRSHRRGWGAYATGAGRSGDAVYLGSDPGLATDLHRFPTYPFDAGEGGEVTDVLRTTSGDVSIATFTYRRAGARGWRSLAGAADTFQIVLAELPVALPYLAVRAAAELGNALPAGTGVRLEYGEFNRRYRIATYDGSSVARKYAVDVLTPRTAQRLLSVEPKDITIYGRYVVCTGHFPGPPRTAVRLLESYGAVLAELVDRIPGHVYATYGGMVERPRGLLDL